VFPEKKTPVISHVCPVGFQKRSQQCLKLCSDLPRH